MKMEDVFELPVFSKTHGVGDRCTMFEGKGVTVASSFYANRLHVYEAMCHAINNHDKLTEENARLMEALTDISNMCIGEVAMGYNLDAQCIGELIYNATGKTNPELNQLLKGNEDE